MQKRFHLFVVSLFLQSVLGLSAMSQEATPDLDARVRSLWEAQGKAWLAAPILSGTAIPPVESATGFWSCPDHKIALEPIRVDGNDRSFTNALVCTKGLHLWVVSSTGPSDPLIWRGPFGTEPKSSSAPEQAKPAGSSPKKNEVLRALYEHFTDSGQQGFYHDRFRNLKRWGKGVLEPLVSIFETDQNPQIRMLALEALGELGDRDLLPTLRKWAQDPGVTANYKLGVAIAMAHLGDRTMIDRAIGQWKQGAAQAVENGDKKSASAAYAQIALVYSRMKDEDASLAHYQKAIELDAGNAVAYYNMACAHAKAGRKDEAFVALGKSIENGFTNFEWMRMDGDLKALRDDPRWKDLLKGK